MPYSTYTKAGLMAIPTDCDEVEALVDASKSLCKTTDTYEDQGAEYTYVTMCGAFKAGVVPNSAPPCTVWIDKSKQMYRVITAAAFLSLTLTSPFVLLGLQDLDCTTGWLDQSSASTVRLAGLGVAVVAAAAASVAIF